MQTKANILSWVLYDFANSFTQIAFSLYFAQWIVVEQGIDDLTFNLAFMASTLFLLITAPVAGFLLDTRFRRITGLRLTTAAMIVAYGTAAMAAVSGHGHMALVLFAGGFYNFLLTFIFYTPLLVEISSTENRGQVSGWGFAANFAGQIAVVFLALPFATGTWSLFGGSSRAETLLPAVIAFAVFAVPMLCCFTEPRKVAAALDLSSAWRQFWQNSRTVVVAPGVGLFLVAHFLFYDAILTAANNFSIFIEQVWMVSDVIKSYILLGIFTTAAVGALVAGALADRFGHLRVFTVVVAGWVIILPLLALIENFTLFVATTTLMGFWYGASWTLSRSVFSYLAPEGGRNLAFGLFGIVERASALLGPLAWGAVATGFVAYGPDRYRFSMLVMTVFVGVALLVLWHLRATNLR